MLTGIIVTECSKQGNDSLGCEKCNGRKWVFTGDELGHVQLLDLVSMRIESGMVYGPILLLGHDIHVIEQLIETDSLEDAVTLAGTLMIIDLF